MAKKGFQPLSPQRVPRTPHPSPSHPSLVPGPCPRSRRRTPTGGSCGTAASIKAGHPGAVVRSTSQRNRKIREKAPTVTQATSPQTFCRGGVPISAVSKRLPPTHTYVRVFLTQSRVGIRSIQCLRLIPISTKAARNRCKLVHSNSLEIFLFKEGPTGSLCVVFFCN